MNDELKQWQDEIMPLTTGEKWQALQRDCVAFQDEYNGGTTIRSGFYELTIIHSGSVSGMAAKEMAVMGWERLTGEVVS